MAAPSAHLWLWMPPLVLAAFYVLGIVREWRRGSPVRAGRLASFFTGCLLLSLALSPVAMHWGHMDLRGHMAQHLLLGMFAPLALVYGAPGTLLLRNMPAVGARRLMGLAGWRSVRVLIHPVTAAFLNVGAMYVLYLTPAFAYTQESPAAHLFVHVHFLVAGYLFVWSIAGPDPAPQRPSLRLRLLVLLLAGAAHGVLGKLMYGYGYPRGVAASPAEIRDAAQWMYYGGDLAGLLLAVMFFAIWFARPHQLFTRGRPGYPGVAR
ncbi:cytochrome c oxidase assembly protein [Halopseudomonas sp.]|uniref:cytochrome c oxidase assembly protein n=1 Tax=Halopseudomonas sp. TaxID=2901191 RepID=UPI0030027C00